MGTVRPKPTSPTLIDSLAIMETGASPDRPVRGGRKRTRPPVVTPTTPDAPGSARQVGGILVRMFINRAGDGEHLKWLNSNAHRFDFGTFRITTIDGERSIPNGPSLYRLEDGRWVFDDWGGPDSKGPHEVSVGKAAAYFAKHRIYTVWATGLSSVTPDAYGQLPVTMGADAPEILVSDLARSSAPVASGDKAPCPSDDPAAAFLDALNSFAARLRLWRTADDAFKPDDWRAGDHDPRDGLDRNAGYAALCAMQDWNEVAAAAAEFDEDRWGTFRVLRQLLINLMKTCHITADPNAGTFFMDGSPPPTADNPDLVALEQLLSDASKPSAPAASVDKIPARKRPAASGDEAPTRRLTPGARAIGAALDMQKEGAAVSLKAVCKRAEVDRPNLKRRYPDAVKAIQALAAPKQAPRRGTRDRRTGDIDGVVDPEE